MAKLLLFCLLACTVTYGVHCQVGYVHSVFAFDNQGTAYSFIYEGFYKAMNSSIIRSEIPVTSNNYLLWRETTTMTLCWPNRAILACITQNRATGELYFSTVNVTAELGPVTLLGGITNMQYTLSTGQGAIAFSFVYDSAPTTAYIAVIKFFSYARKLENITATNSFQVPLPVTTVADLTMFATYFNNDSTIPLQLYEQAGVLYAFEPDFQFLPSADFNVNISDPIEAREIFDQQLNVNITTGGDDARVIYEDGILLLLPIGAPSVVLGSVDNSAPLYALTVKSELNSYLAPLGSLEPSGDYGNGNTLGVDDSIYYLIIIVGIIMPAGCFMWSIFKCCCGGNRRGCCHYWWCFPFQGWAWAGACASHSLTTFFVAPMITKKCDGFNFAMKSWAFVYEALSDMLVTLVAYYIFRDAVNDFVLVLICSIIGFALRVPIKIMLFFFMRRFKDENSLKSKPCHWWLWLPCVCITAATIAPWIAFLVLLESDLPQILLIWAITQGLMLAIEWQVKYVVFVFEGQELTRDSISAMRYTGDDVEAKSGCATCMFIFLAFFSGAQIADSVGPVGDAVLERTAHCC